MYLKVILSLRECHSVYLHKPTWYRSVTRSGLNATRKHGKHEAAVNRIKYVKITVRSVVST